MKGFLFIFVATVISTSYAARILAIMPFPSYSHQVVFQPLWRELSLRGHQVTLLTTDPLNDPTLKNLREIDLHFAYDLWDGKNNLTGIINESANIMDMMLTFMQIISEIMDAELGHEQVQKLISGPADQFDLFMVEYLQPTMFAFRHKFKVPMIGVISLESHANGHEAMGNPTHPILYPEFSMPVIPPLSFIDRLKIMLFMVFTWFIMPRVIAMEDATIKKHFGQDCPSLVEIQKDIDIMLVNANPALQPARPTVPGTIYIGGGIHLQKPKRLPKVRGTRL